MFSYRVYGLALSSNQPIPGLIPQPVARADLQVWLRGSPQWLDAVDKHSFCSSSTIVDSPVVQVFSYSGRYWWRYRDDTEFIVDERGDRIWADWPSTLTLEDTVTYLLGPVLGWVLRLRQVVCLHASAIAIDGRAIALVGRAGAGKSTTAAAFAKLGYPVLSDDVVPLIDGGDRFAVQSAYPRIRLWSDSVAALYQSPEALPRIVPTHPTWDKRYLDLTQSGYTFQEQPLPLAKIYLLSPRTTSAAAPCLMPLSPPAGLMALVKNTYANSFLSSSLRAQEFELLSRLVKQIPLQRLVPHADPSRLNQLCEAVLTDTECINSSG